MKLEIEKETNYKGEVKYWLLVKDDTGYIVDCRTFENYEAAVALMEETKKIMRKPLKEIIKSETL